jgi:hypothetical protein
MALKTGPNSGKKHILTPSAARKEKLKQLSLRYYLQGQTTLKDVAARIADEHKMSVSYTTVYNYITEAMATWAKENLERITDYKHQELARINALQMEYWAAWERSLNPHVISHSKQTPLTQDKPRRGKKGPELLLNERHDTLHPGLGNKKFLDGVQWCITKRLEIMASLQVGMAEADNAGTAITNNNTVIRQIVMRTNKTLIAEPQTTVTREASGD